MIKETYYKQHKEKILQQAKERYLLNKEVKIAYSKKYAEENKEKVKQWKKKHRDKPESKSKRRVWIINNKEQINKRISEYTRKRESIDPCFKIAKRLRHRVNTAVKGNLKSGSAIKDLGCSVNFLKTYLESKFSYGMSWDNYGEWHIDHIKPLVLFDLTDEKQFKVVSHYTNLQPLWALDNILKRDKTYEVTR